MGASRRCLFLVVCAWLAGCGGGAGDRVGSTAQTADNAPGAGIFGRLVDDSEQPVPNAIVELRDPNNAVIGRPVVTNENGEFEFEFEERPRPETLVLHIRHGDGPQLEAAVDYLPGSRLDIQVTIEREGGVVVHTDLLPPADAPVIDRQAGMVYAVNIGADGRSEPFQLQVRGAFDPARADLRLIWRGPEDERWVVSPPSRQDAPVGFVPLDLGRRAGELHGSVIEVRALAAPLGTLAGVTSLARPRDLGDGVVVSGRRLRVVPVARSERRIVAGGFGEDAVVAVIGARGEVGLSVADAQRLGLLDGQQVRLEHDGRSASVRVRYSTDPVLQAATLILSPHEFGRLGLDRSDAYAGFEIRVGTSGTDGGSDQHGADDSGDAARPNQSHGGADDSGDEDGQLGLPRS